MADRRSRLLMTTTAYPPSTGGVQAHVADLRRQLVRYEADIATLWLQNRTDWLLGTTLRLNGPHAALPQRGTEIVEEGREDGVEALAWPATVRGRMLPWVVAYYALVPLASQRIAALMTPFVDRLVRPDHVLIHNHRIGREFLALASLQVARRRNLPFVLTPHHHPKWRGGYRYAGWLKAYRSADAVLAHTPAEEQELIRLGVEAERIHLIWCGADDPLPADGRRFRAQFANPDAPLVLFVGQLYRYKGVADLLEAVDMLHARGIDANLAYIGPGTPFSRRFFERRGRPWLRILGKVSAQEKWDAIEAASVVCLPSAHEAFGRIYLEAWSKNKPVIGGRIPAVKDVIEDGRSGLLVTPGSAGELSQALARLLTDPTLAAQMGERGAQRVRDRFNWPQVVRRIESSYDAARKRVSGRSGVGVAVKADGA
jgi:glycosyltransferase involved in cell wall biosynthesis